MEIDPWMSMETIHPWVSIETHGYPWTSWEIPWTLNVGLYRVSMESPPSFHGDFMEISMETPKISMKKKNNVLHWARSSSSSPSTRRSIFFEVKTAASPPLPPTEDYDQHFGHLQDAPDDPSFRVLHIVSSSAASRRELIPEPGLLTSLLEVRSWLTATLVLHPSTTAQRPHGCIVIADY